MKEGAWLEPGLALLRKKVMENWRNIFLERGWTQKRLFDIGWSDVSQCQACQLEEGTEKHRLHHCPEWYEIKKVGAKGENVEERVEVAKRYRRAPSQRKPMNRGHFSTTVWESEKHKSWSMTAEGFKVHVATKYSLCLLGYGWKVGSMWLGSGTTGLR